MICLYIIGEGYTERRFVEALITEHLEKYDISTTPSLFTTKLDHTKGLQHKGGISSYKKIREEIKRWLMNDNRDCLRITTMIDLYGLPKDFPSYNAASRESDPFKKVDFLQKAFAADIKDSRFIPYIQLHEFEALLFADPCKLKYEYFENDRQINELIELSKKQNPEMINEGPTTCPSKRIKSAIKSYDKVYAGSEVAKAIGLTKIRERCKHFDQWLCELEKL